MKRILLAGVMLGLCALTVHAEDYYDLEHYQIVPDTTTNKNDIRFRGDFKLYDSTHIADFDSLTPKVIFYASGTVVCPRLETQEFIALSTGAFIPVGDKIGFDGDADSNDYIESVVNDVVRIYAGGNPYISAHDLDSALYFHEDVRLLSGKKLYLDGGVDTYIYEDAADRVTLYVGGVPFIQCSEGAVTRMGLLQDTAVEAAKKLYLDGGVDTYISEFQSGTDNDRVGITVGGDLMLQLAERPAGNSFVGIHGVDLYIDDGNKFYLDGLNDTYMFCPGGSDSIQFYGGNRFMMEIVGHPTGVNQYVQVKGTFTIPSGAQLNLDGAPSGDTYITEDTINEISLFCGSTLGLKVDAGGIGVVYTHTGNTSTDISIPGNNVYLITANGLDGGNTQNTIGMWLAGMCYPSSTAAILDLGRASTGAGVGLAVTAPSAATLRLTTSSRSSAPDGTRWRINKLN